MLNRDMFKGIVADLTNPDKLADALVKLNDEVEELFAAHDKAVSDISARDERIRGLQDTNQKLFLRVTGNPGEEDRGEPEEKTPEQIMAEMAKRIRGDEDGN